MRRAEALLVRSFNQSPTETALEIESLREWALSHASTEDDRYEIEYGLLELRLQTTTDPEQGGAIALSLLAMDHPHRLRTLTTIAAFAATCRRARAASTALPILRTAFERMDWSTQTRAVKQARVDLERIIRELEHAIGD